MVVIILLGISICLSADHHVIFFNQYNGTGDFIQINLALKNAVNFSFQFCPVFPDSALQKPELMMRQMIKTPAA